MPNTESPVTATELFGMLEFGDEVNP